LKSSSVAQMALQMLTHALPMLDFQNARVTVVSTLSQIKLALIEKRRLQLWFVVGLFVWHLQHCA
jgi:hypothetical protein